MPPPPRFSSSRPALRNPALRESAATPAKRPAILAGWSRPGRPRLGLSPVVSYPVFERVMAAPVDTPPEDAPAGEGDDLTWCRRAPLAEAARTLRPGLFVVERSSGGRWRPVFVGMSAVGVGQAIRWILQAPAIIGLPADWDSLRARVAEAGFDTAGPAGRAALRRRRDEVARSLGAAEGRRVPVGPGPIAAPSR